MAASAIQSQIKLNKQAMPMISMLSAQLLLGMAENLIGKPDSVSGADKVFSAIILTLHILIGLGLIVRGTLILRSAMKQGGRMLRIARIGLSGVLVAFLAGILIMATTTGDSWWSYLMTIGFLAAFLAYGTLFVRGAKD